MIILDISANTHKNSMSYVKRMIDELVKVDSRKHEVVIKHQLFTEAGDNIPLQLSVFDYAYWYAEQQGYQTTASVFDTESLYFLLSYDIPFVKIANNMDLYYLAEKVPNDIPVIVSIGYPCGVTADIENKRELMCVSEYPAKAEQYEERFGQFFLRDGISDHTTDFYLWHMYSPVIYECHYKLADSTGLDAGDFARTPDALSEIL